MEYRKIIIKGEVTNYSISESGIVRNDIKNKNLKGSRGYNCWYFQLSLKKGKYNFEGHKLMEVFIGEQPSPTAIIIHKDGNKYNNHKDNLYWYEPDWNENWKTVIINGEETPFLVNKLGEVKNSKTGTILKGDTSKSYCYYNLRYNKKQKTKSGHRLVAEAFIPNPENLPYVHHIDHNRLNNNVNNLQWVSEAENAKDTLPIKRQESFYSLTYNSLPNEFWKNYKNTHYEVSNLGRVRNLKTMKILKGSVRVDGYTQHCVNKKKVLTHILVIETFLRELDNGEEINHINCIKTDNRLENLEIVSHDINMKKASEHGLCGAKKVGRYDYEGNLLQVYYSTSAAARDIGILSSSLRNIINYKSGKRGKEFFRYIDEGSSTNRVNKPEAQNS